MLGSERRVAITGLGLVTPLGRTPDSIWAAVSEGRGMVRPLKAFRVAGLPTGVGAEIQDFDLKNYSLPRYWTALRKTKKYLARDIQLAVAAAQLAVVDAGLAEGGVDPTRIGIDLGAGLISSELDELAPAIGQAYGAGKSFDFQAWGRESIEMIEPIWLLKYLPNMLACHISILMDCQGPSNTITEADASSNLAIAEAARIIARGRADVMITGGADSKIHPLRPCRGGRAIPARRVGRSIEIATAGCRVRERGSSSLKSGRMPNDEGRQSSARFWAEARAVTLCPGVALIPMASVRKLRSMRPLKRPA
jgi:3-oxoacyl-[acyl-carrier-protein] synthase II